MQKEKKTEFGWADDDKTRISFAPHVSVMNDTPSLRTGATKQMCSESLNTAEAGASHCHVSAKHKVPPCLT